MATFRKIHTSIWSDPWFADLDSEKKLFYIYLLTNERTKQCGIYEITKKQISFDTGYSIDTVSILLKYFIDTQKIRYNYITNEIAIKNWRKYNVDTSPKVKQCVNRELKLVKDIVLIQYLYSIDTHMQKEKEKEKKEEKEKEEEPITQNENYFTPEPEKTLKPLNEILLCLTDDQIWYEVICMNYKLTISQFNEKLIEFINLLKGDGVKEKSINDAKQHFNRWLGIALEKNRYNQNSKFTKEQIDYLKGLNDTRRKQKLKEYTIEEYYSKNLKQ